MLIRPVELDARVKMAVLLLRRQWAEYRDMQYEAGLIPRDPRLRTRKGGNRDKRVPQLRHEMGAQFDLQWRNPEDRLGFTATYNIRSDAETTVSVWKRGYSTKLLRSGIRHETYVVTVGS